MNKTSKKIDWFTIDMDAFQEAYDELLEAIAEYEEVSAQAEACRNRTCQHGPFKKDGTPHRGRECENDEGFKAYNKECNLGNALHYQYHIDFFKRIGLVGEDK